MAVDVGRQIDTGGEDLIVRDIFINASAPGQPGTKITSAGNITGPITSPITPLAGTATVAPLKLTSGTNLTTAQAGAIEYDGSAFYADAQASTRQMIDAEQWIVAQIDNTFPTAAISSGAGTAVFSSPASGQVTLPVGQFTFEGQYIITDVNSGTSHAYQTQFGGTAGLSGIQYSTTGWLSTGGGSSTTSFGLSAYANVATRVIATNTSSSATTNGIITVYGMVTVSAGGGGTFIPQISPSVAISSNSGTPVIKAGSFFRIWGMAAASTASVGNWS